jgi:hypothetical protein
MFIAQATLEAWLDAGQARLEGEVVRLEAARLTYRLDAAVRFVATVDGAEEGRLEGKVLTEARVHALGGEILGDSVLFGEAAFQIEPGFIGTLLDPPTASREIERTS